MTSNLRALGNAEKKRKKLRETMPLMSQMWNPESVKDVINATSGGTFYTEYSWRGLLHTTEGSSYAGARAAFIANNSAPHFTTSFEDGIFESWQHFPLDRAARSLKNAVGGVETGRARCIQVEIVGKAGSSSSFPTPYLDGIARLMRWIEAQTGIQRVAPAKPFASAYGQSGKRLTPSEWRAFNGWCGHGHCPENDHWDPGLINIQYLLNYSTEVKPMFDPPIPMVAYRENWMGTGTYWLGQDGAVYATGGALYWGGVNGQLFFAGRKAANILTPAEAGPQFAPYKYVIQATSGEKYGCPWQ